MKCLQREVRISTWNNWNLEGKKEHKSINAFTYFWFFFTSAPVNSDCHLNKRFQASEGIKNNIRQE